jgi:hypothetical protein
LIAVHIGPQDEEKGPLAVRTGSLRTMPKNSNEPWKASDDELLLEPKADGRSDKAMAVALGRSTGSIAGRLSLLNTIASRLKGDQATAASKTRVEE